MLTGVAGLLGYNFATWLLNHTKHMVIGVDALYDWGNNNEVNPSIRYDFHQLDLTNHYNKLDEIVRQNGVKIIYHFASYAAEGLSPFMRRFNYMQNTVASANVINIAIKYDCKLIFTSSMSVYGHGKSTHDESLYYLDVNGDDLIWFIDHVIGEATVVAGHSNGAITAAYVAAYGGANVIGAVLEDPPVFSTEGENWEKHFSYLDTFKPLHEYDESDKTECWEAWYLRHCYWGQLYIKDLMPLIADDAQKYHDEHPGEPVKIAMLPSDIWYIFQYEMEYDFAYGEHFYDLSWNHGLKHEDILSSIHIPCVYIHAMEVLDQNGINMAAATREQAERAVSYIGDNCRLIETDTNDHIIHTKHSKVYIDAVNSMLR